MSAAPFAEGVAGSTRAHRSDGERPLSVVVPLPPSYRGGTEEYAYRLVQGFSRHVPTAALTTDVRWDASANLLSVGEATLERLPATEIMERPLLWSPRSRARLRRKVATARGLNLHMPFPLVEAPMARLAHAAGAPVVLTYHMDADLGSARPGGASGAVTRIYRRLSAHPALYECDYAVSNSRGYAEASPVLSRHLAKVRVIPKGIDRARFQIGTAPARVPRPPQMPRSTLPATTRRIAFVGRLVPYKGVPILLRACEQLLREGRDLELMIAGRGPMLPELQSQVRELRIEDRVQFLGFVPDELISPLYRYADLTVVPSVSSLESSATALEEAAACGCPVVGSALPGANESIPNDGRRGLLVPPSDPTRLAAAMARMLDAPRPELPDQVRSWDDVVSDYIELFRSLGVRIGG